MKCEIEGCPADSITLNTKVNRNVCSTHNDLINVTASLIELKTLIDSIPAGPQGEQGPQGDQGPQGPQGEQGPPGMSAMYAGDAELEMGDVEVDSTNYGEEAPCTLGTTVQTS